MKLALITDGITPYVTGGMQRHSFNLAQSLALQGVEIDLYHTDKGAGRSDLDELKGMLPEAKQRINSIPLPWPSGDRLPGHYLRELAQYSREALSIFQQRPPVDFIYAKGLTGGAFLKAKAAGQTLPSIGVKAHGYEMFQIPPNLKLKIQHLMLRPAFRNQARQADVVFSYGGKITEIIRDKLGVADDRIREIPGGISSSWLSDAPSPVSQPRRFVFMGRYERRKGIEELHRVIRDHEAWQVNSHFSFIGPIEPSRQLSLPHVQYHGLVSSKSDILSLLRQGDLLICPSFSEGMPNVILEAMASGLAVIGTDVGAVSSLVQHAETGFLIPPGDLPALTEAIDTCIHMPEDSLSRMKEAAQNHVKTRYTWETIGQQTLKTIEELKMQR